MPPDDHPDAWNEPSEADLEVTAALAHRTGERLGAWILLAVETVARTHPDMLRESIGKVMDLALYEAEVRRVRAALQKLQTEALALRQEMGELRDLWQELREMYLPRRSA